MQLRHRFLRADLAALIALTGLAIAYMLTTHQRTSGNRIAESIERNSGVAVRATPLAIDPSPPLPLKRTSPSDIEATSSDPAAKIADPFDALRSGSMLAVVRFSYSKRVPNADAAAMNTFLNPSKKVLSDASKQEIDRLLHEIIVTESELDAEYIKARTQSVKAAVKGGRFETRLPGDAGTFGQIQPREAEEEVASFASSRQGTGYVRIHWGDFADLDSIRIKIYDFKVASAEKLVNVIKGTR